MNNYFNKKLNDFEKPYADALKQVKQVNSQINEFQKQNKAGSATSNGDNDRKQKLNFVIKNRFLFNKVNGLLRDGLKLAQVKITRAERRQQHNRRPNSRPGVVVATAESEDEKIEIMKSKRNLKDSLKYKKVLIKNDTTLDQRRHEAYLRTVLRELGKSDKYKNKSGRLIIKSN